MPVAPPVITAVFPFSLFMSCILRSSCAITFHLSSCWTAALFPLVQGRYILWITDPD
jgi:hypothetical protein